MRTNIVINDELMNEALLLSGLSSKRETVEAGLRLLVQQKRQQQIRELRGTLHWEGNLAEMRGLMIIADTGIWIDYFNGVINLYSNRLDQALQDEQVALTDIILMEILQGFRSEKEYSRAKTALNALPCFEILGVKNALRYAEYYRTLRKQGITIRKNNDVMIAGFCIVQRIPLLFNDRDFEPFVKYLGLQTVL